jgi:hypothetical protein
MGYSTPADRRWGPEREWQNALNERFPRHPRQIPDRDPIYGRARIVWERDGEEWVPAKAIRWNRDHVFVVVGDPRCSAIGFWLSLQDFRRRAAPGGGSASPQKQATDLSAASEASRAHSDSDSAPG